MFVDDDDFKIGKPSKSKLKRKEARQLKQVSFANGGALSSTNTLSAQQMLLMNLNNNSDARSSSLIESSGLLQSQVLLQNQIQAA